MLTYITRRLFLMIPTVIGMTFLVFAIIAASPGGIGAAQNFAGGGEVESGSVALQRAYLEDRYGLDEPIPAQYLRWLGRVSPVKFGPRDQRPPSGERLRPPREIKPLPLADWFEGADTPVDDQEAWLAERGVVGGAFAEDATKDDKASIYRRVAADYARERSQYIGAAAQLETTVGEALRLAGRDDLVERDGRAIIDRVDSMSAAEARDLMAEGWPSVEAAAAEAILQRGEAAVARERLDVVFAAQPFEQTGIPIIPGTVTLDAPDLGVSFSRSRPVSRLIADALPNTLLLNIIAIPIIYLIAIPTGMLAAVRQGRLADVGTGALFIALLSIPTVLAGVLAMGFLASETTGLGWFPIEGLSGEGADDMAFLPAGGERGWLLDRAWHIALPVLCLVYGGFAILSKQTRAAMLDNFNADYVRTAKAKGVPAGDIVWAHVFRNSLLPLITLFVSVFPAMLAGSVVIERIFNIPGMGLLLIEAINLRDREVILANALIIGVVNMLALLLADVLYAVADPRISYD